MKNLLIIAYYFPPSGGPGVQRVLKHIKYLPDYGWNPIVYTVKDAQYPAFDYSLLDEIPENVKVYRSKIFEPYNLYRKIVGIKGTEPVDVNVIKKENQKLSWKEKISEFIRATFFIPDARMFWYFSGRKELKKAITENQIDAIYSSSPPYTTALIAKRVKKILRVPWIAGFRDPWTGFISSPRRWFLPRLIDKYLEKSVFKKADKIECAWVGIIKDAVSKYPDLDKTKFHHIPNGFDSEDYPSIEWQGNEQFTLTYTGSMYGRRNPAALFQAIEKLLKNNLIKKDEFKIKFIGRFGREISEMIENTTFRDSIEIINYLPHKESLIELLKSDALLLIVDESKESEEIVPGKIYEYIGTKKPILTIAPNNGAVAQLMKETGLGLVAYQSEIDKIADNFLMLLKAYKNNEDILNINEDIIIKYERRESARQLAILLDESYAEILHHN